MARSGPRWGWHQLDPAAARKLVADAQLPPRALVLDIGAGHGAITAPLVDAGHRVLAVEVHPGRARVLADRFDSGVRVIRADAGDLRLPTRPFHVVANPPYAVLTALLKRLLHPGSRLVSAHLVVPTWAVQRWRGTVPSRGGSFRVAGGPVVPRQRFTPPPRSHSQVLVVRRR